MGRDPAEAPLSSQSYVGQYIVTVAIKKSVNSTKNWLNFIFI